MTSPLTTGKRRRRFDKYQLMLGDGMAAMSSSYMNSFDDCNFAALFNKLEYVTGEINHMNNASDVSPNLDEQLEIIRHEIEIGISE